MPLILPSSISRFIGSARLIRDTIGESPCQVFRFNRGGECFFLKRSPVIHAPTTYSVEREAALVQWLAGRLNVPELVLVDRTDVAECMITRAVPGRPLSSVSDAPRQLDLFHEALRQVQAVSIADCPFDAGAAVRLRELGYLLAHGLAADDHDLRQWPGITTPAALQRHLHATMPVEDLVFSHGDLGDSNVFVDAKNKLHFIDLGRAGKADRWLDIAFIHRHLREEHSSSLAANFLLALDRPDASAKRLFHEQLDELF